MLKVISKGVVMEIKSCETLEDLRKEIDKVDEKIVELIAVRNDYT